MINARSETAHEKPSFRQALKSRRCIVPANGFYEWQKSGKEKIPHYIRFRDNQIMSFAGLWEAWRSSDGQTVESCTILTTEANSLLKPIHDRMPVILDQQEHGHWLSTDRIDAGELDELFHPYPAERLEEYVVSREVNSPINDSPDLILASPPCLL
jgi:putative SOS response-associated peptidase YedK